MGLGWWFAEVLVNGDIALAEGALGEISSSLVQEIKLSQKSLLGVPVLK